MPPVAAAYTLIPFGTGLRVGAGAEEWEPDGLAGLLELFALVGVPFPAEQAVAIMPSAKAIAAARNQGGVDRGSFTGGSIPGGPRARCGLR